MRPNGRVRAIVQAIHAPSYYVDTIRFTARHLERLAELGGTVRSVRAMVERDLFNLSQAGETRVPRA